MRQTHADMEAWRYPQWWLERAAERRKRLDAAVERLREQLGGLESVRLALVFGSYGRNQVGPTSDLDVIVVQETELPQTQRAAELYARLGCAVPLDLIVYTPQEFERLQRTRSFVRQAVAEGRTIYARAPA